MKKAEEAQKKEDSNAEIYLNLIASLNTEQQVNMDKFTDVLKKAYNERTRQFVERSIEHRLLQNRMHVVSQAATNYCIEYDSNGKERDSSDLREELREEYNKAVAPLFPV